MIENNPQRASDLAAAGGIFSSLSDEQLHEVAVAVGALNPGVREMVARALHTAAAGSSLHRMSLDFLSRAATAGMV